VKTGSGFLSTRFLREPQRLEDEDPERRITLKCKTFCRAWILSLLIVLLPAISGAIGIRPYGKLGFILISPSAADLGFVLAGDGSMDDALDKDLINFGAGGQFLYDLDKSLISGVQTRLGMDMGIQTLFGYKFQANPSTTAWEEHEYDMYFHGIVEFKMDNSPLFLQAGIGPHFIFWTEDSEFKGKYSYSYDSDSGTDINFSLMISAGYELQAGKNMTIPIMVRLDNLLRYDLMVDLDVMIGVSLNY